jgi:Arc/MetJ family transcription regulator
MTKRQIDIDDDLLEQVRAFFGTRTIKDTVNSALAEIAQYPERLTALDRWISAADPDGSEWQYLNESWQRDLDTWSTRARSTGSTSSPCTPDCSHSSPSEDSPPAP